MATKKKIISADTLEKDNKKTNKKSSSGLDLEKVQDFVTENKGLISRIATIIGGLFITSKTKKIQKTKKTKNKKTSKNNSDVLDTLSSLLKK